MLAAMVVHGTWNAMDALADGNGLVVSALLVVITAVSIAALVLALRWGPGRERGYLRDILAPEVTRGTLTDVELTALTGERSHRRRDRRAAVRARPDGVSRRQEKHVLTAALDLAHDLSESRGEDTGRVEHSRAEIARLRGL